MVNLKQSESRISDTWSVKLIFSLIVTFHLTETENRTKRSIDLSRGTISHKNNDFLHKKMLK